MITIFVKCRLEPVEGPDYVRAEGEVLDYDVYHVGDGLWEYKRRLNKTVRSGEDLSWLEGLFGMTPTRSSKKRGNCLLNTIGFTLDFGKYRLLALRLHV